MRINPSRDIIRKNERSLQVMVFFISLVLIVMIIAISLILILRSEGEKNKIDLDYITFQVGTEKHKIDYNACVIDEKIYIDIDFLDPLLNFVLSGTENSPKYIISDGQSLLFTCGKNIVKVNDQTVLMAGKVIKYKESILVPVEFLENIIEGLSFKYDAQKGIMNISANGEINFLAKSNDTLKELDEVETIIEFKSDLSEYEKYMNPENKDGYLILVNKEKTLDSSYVIDDKYYLDTSYTLYSKDVPMSEIAGKAMEAMIKELHENGYSDVYVTSAYRTYSYQKILFDMYVQQEMAKGLSQEEAEIAVVKYSALPGTSEHQTGLCADLMSTRMGELNNEFAENAAYNWLCDNAWKFGFILRYPEDKTDITGYEFESWHYRFVGRYHAARIHVLGISLEEYIELLENE